MDVSVLSLALMPHVTGKPVLKPCLGFNAIGGEMAWPT